MINYLKSSISISSYNGCSIGCKYCILSVFENREKVEKICNEEELVNNLLNFNLYTKEIPISINNQSDPFLNQIVFESTLKILEIMERKKVQNPLLIITKGYLNDIQIEKISKIHLNIIVLYTFSGISETLENRDENKQIETMRKLSKLKNIKLMNYYRPVIEGINSDIETIKKVVKTVTKYCKASIVSGIRINSYLEKVLNNMNIKIPNNYDPDHKNLLPETYDRILKEFKKRKSNYPVFKKTSCGVSYINNQADYNGHSARIYYCKKSCPSYSICFGSNKIGFCNKDCPNYFRCKKASEKKVTNEEFEKLLEHIGKADTKYEIKEHYIYLTGTYWQEEVSYLRHKTKKNIKADKLLKRADELAVSQ